MRQVFICILLIVFGVCLHAQNYEALPGRFYSHTENGDTLYVQFSSGNLQYHTTENTWRLAEHQYDFVGGTEFGNREDYNYGNVYATSLEGDSTKCNNHEWLQDGSEYSGWIDLFGWGTGNNPLKSTLDVSFSLDENDKWDGSVEWTDSCSYSYHEWGDNIVSTDRNWTTLSSYEFSTLLKHCFVQGHLLDVSITLGDGQYAGGTIIFPDGWDNSLSNPYRDGNLLRLTQSQWEDLEQAGAVILPSAGGMMYTYDYYSGLKWRYSFTVEYNDGYGNFYWTSSSLDESEHYAECVRTDFEQDDTSSGKRYVGSIMYSYAYRKLPVRLVQVERKTTALQNVYTQINNVKKVVIDGQLYFVDAIGQTFDVCGRKLK